MSIPGHTGNGSRTSVAPSVLDTDAAEMALVGSLLICDPSAPLLPKVTALVCAADFRGESARDVFLAILACHGRGEPADPVLVLRELEHRGVLETIGGREFLADLATAVPTAASAPHYARLVREASRGRQLLAALRQCDRRILAGGDFKETVAAARAAIEDAAFAEDGAELPWIDGDTLVASPDVAEVHVVEDLLIEAGVFALAGPAKIGKTKFLNAAILGPLSRGEATIFDLRPPSEPITALVLSEEAPGAWQRYLRECGVRGATLLPRGAFPASLSWPGLLDAASRKMRDVGARILVVDTLASLARLGSDGENDPQRVQAALDPVYAAVAEHNRTASLLCHTSKAREDGGDPSSIERMRGSGHLGAAVTTIGILARPSRLPDRRRERMVHVTGRLRGEPYSASCELVPHGDSTPATFRRIDVDPEAIGRAKAAVRQSSILAVLNGADPLTLGEIASSAHIRREDVLGDVPMLVKQGSVHVWRPLPRKRALRYGLTPPPALASPPVAGSEVQAVMPEVLADVATAARQASEIPIARRRRGRKETA